MSRLMSAMCLTLITTMVMAEGVIDLDPVEKNEINVKMTQEEYKVWLSMKQEVQRKIDRRIRATYNDDYTEMTLKGDKEDLKAFYDLGLSIWAPKDWREDGYWITKRAYAMKMINDDNCLRLKLNGFDGYRAKRNIQDTIDAWPGDFEINNPVPTARRLKKDKSS